MGAFRTWLLDIIFPRQCLGCKILLSDKEKSYLCPSCLAEIKIKNDFACAFCGSPVIAGLTCHFCRPAHFLDRLWVATSYENPLVEKAVKTMKYRFVKTLTEDMAGLMAGELEKRFASGPGIGRDSIIVVPVPLHRLRLNWRGFNQAEEIGGKIGARLGLKSQRDVLERKYHRAPQARITDRESRIANTKEVFECRKPELARDKTVLLVDDIATTGSTLDDCARALKGAGAKEIIGFVFARGTPVSDQRPL
jgi:ComF family protein